MGASYGNPSTSTCRTYCCLIFATGTWFIASPWIYGFTGNWPLMWNNIILGAIVAKLSFIAGWVLVMRPESFPERASVQR
ncbi:MAG: SPW repeat protein [Dehalococcoidia bacterium]|nr:SPW repeat protein [Dehalococcoidia bacterium]